MEKATKIALAVTGLIIVGGGIGAYFFFKRQRDKTKSHSQGITESEFARLVQAAQYSPDNNKFKGMSSKDLDALYMDRKNVLSTRDVNMLVSLFNKGEDRMTKQENNEYKALLTQI